MLFRSACGNSRRQPQYHGIAADRNPARQNAVDVRRERVVLARIFQNDDVGKDQFGLDRRERFTTVGLARMQEALAEPLDPGFQLGQRRCVIVDRCLDHQRPRELGLRPDALGGVQRRALAVQRGTYAQRAIAHAMAWIANGDGARREALLGALMHRGLKDSGQPGATANDTTVAQIVEGLYRWWEGDFAEAAAALDAAQAGFGALTQYPGQLAAVEATLNDARARVQGALMGAVPK